MERYGQHDTKRYEDFTFSHRCTSDRTRTPPLPCLPCLIRCAMHQGGLPVPG